MPRDFFIRTDDAVGAAVVKQAKRERRSLSNLFQVAVVAYLRSAGAMTEEQATDAAEAKRPGRKPKAKAKRGK